MKQGEGGKKGRRRRVRKKVRNDCGVTPCMGWDGEERGRSDAALLVASDYNQKCKLRKEKKRSATKRCANI